MIHSSENARTILSLSKKLFRRFILLAYKSFQISLKSVLHAFCYLPAVHAFLLRLLLKQKIVLSDQK